MKNIAIVTGASSGLGREFVKLLLKEKELDQIWAVARRKQKLDQLVEKYGDKVKTYTIDLSDQDAILEFGELIKKKKPNIRYLINNAGYAKFCSYDGLSVMGTINMIDVNCSAPVALTLLALPYMRRGSHILNISSQASFQPLPYQNVYSSTKVFLRNYTRALHVELKGKDISATAVCPGWMRTALYQRAKVGAKKTVNNFLGMVTPDKVARKALCDAKRNRDMSVYGIYTKSCHVAAKVLPQKTVMKIWMMQQRF